MFKEFFSLEIRSAFKRPMVYIFFFLIALFAFLAIVSDSVQIGGSIGNVKRNAPFVVTQFVAIFSFLGVLFAVAFFNNAALRDHENKFSEILFSTPLGKGSYFFGRFFGALILATVPLMGIYFGVVLGSFIGPLAGWIEADRVGPVPLQTFLNTYFLFILPNMFIAGAIVFGLATKFKSTVISFVGALGILIAYGISGALLSDIDNETIGGLLDTFGIRALSVETRYYTPIEKNTLAPAFRGILLWNRLIWAAFGLVVLLLTYFSFSFKEKQSKARNKEKMEELDSSIFAKIVALPSFTFSTNWLQFKSLFKISFLNIVKSIVFKVLFLFALILMLVGLIDGYEYFGLQSYPLTYITIDTITSSTNLFIFIIFIFFSGELIWNDRSSHINEVVNATPHGSVISLLSKAATLLGVVSLLYFLFSVVGIVYQLLMGFIDIEFGLYATTFIFDLLPGYLFYSIFFIFLQVVINQKYQAYFISILFIAAFAILLNVLDIESNMLDLGSGPFLQYSDMNGFGPGFTSAMWFALYWTLFAGILLAIAGLFMVRSSGGNFKVRLKTAKTNFNKKFGLSFLILAVLWLGTASFVYYNTQVLNPYDTADETEEILVKYEKKYKRYENIVLPKITDVTYHIDIFPNKRDVLAKAELVVKNTSNQAIDSIHYNLNDDWETNILIPNSELVLDDDTFGYQIYQLEKPMLPGDEMAITIESNYITKGFENGRGNTQIIKNGTFLNNSVIPSMGYNAGAEISDKNDRKKFDLPPKSRMPDLVMDSCKSECLNNYLSDGRSDWVNIETFISTAEDQLAIAPGSLVKEWNENGRNYYHYKVDHIAQDFCSFVSADYQVAKRNWNGISMEVYYDEKHDYNIDLMLDAIEKSLKYYTENFGPYYHKQARIIEFPRYATFAQAFPGTMPYSEAFGFITNLEDTAKNNVIDAVVAHEMAHQWWAHQEVGATMQGGTMLTESFAEYSSLMVMKQQKDALGMKEFLKYDFRRYLRGRSNETEKELPLYKVENQTYIHYGKGSVILYALQDYIGEENVNRALRSFLEEFKYRKPPYPTSMDFLRHLEKEIPDSLNYLIEDWFKEITLYDLRLENASFTKTNDGRYKVDLDINAQKLRADTIGNETEVAMKDWLDVGVYKDEDEKELLFVKRIQLESGNQQVSFEVDTIPAKAIIDPKRLLIERVTKDNIKGF